MNFKKLITRYRQFGGMWLVVAYARLGVSWPAVKAGVRCLTKGQSFKEIYPEALRRVESVLVPKYGYIVQEFKGSRSSRNDNDNNASTGGSGVSPSGSVTEKKVIWWCWLQGIENAPEIVRACYRSLERHLVQEFNGSKVQRSAERCLGVMKNQEAVHEEILLYF